MPDTSDPSSFITNSPEKVLKSRISDLISVSQELKFLVGFFYYSGISQLYEALKNNTAVKFKVLVGLNVDKTAFGLMEYGATEKLDGNQQQSLFKDSIIKSINSDRFDTQEFYEQASFFIQAIIDGRLIIKKTRDPNHAKLYIFKFDGDHCIPKPCVFITGSSNLTSAGLSHQNEFNVELSDFGTAEAEAYFDDLWNYGSVEITEDNVFKKELIRVLTECTLIAKVTPYEAYAFILKTYLETRRPKNFQEYIFQLLENKGYKKYQYQVDAVAQALSIIEQENGVIISDVVGLGKSIIASMVAKFLGKRGIIICPPALKGEPGVDGVRSGWSKYVHDFELLSWEIRSCGEETLEKTLSLVQNEPDFGVIIVDEAHRFRNQDTEAYQTLSNICRGKVVILLTATPFNNTPADIFSLLKLFVVPGKSNLTLSNNLDAQFRHYSEIFRRLSNIKKNYQSSNPVKKDKAQKDYKVLFDSNHVDIKKVTARARSLSLEIRQVISKVTIRRNRIDLRTDPEYSKEIYELSNIKDPQEAFFELTHDQSSFYDRVVSEYFAEDGLFTGAIYQPFLYETGDIVILNEAQNIEKLTQTNLFEFMRRLLVKRFESSFGAFKESITNFQRVSIKVLKFIETSGQYILDRKIVEQLADSDEDDIELALQDYAQKLVNGSFPKNYKVYKLSQFVAGEKFLADIRSDIKLLDKILKELDDLHLVADNDPKLAKLCTFMKDVLNKKEKNTEPVRKVIIFSEYLDTVKYVESHLEKQFPGQIITIKGDFNKIKEAAVLSNFDTTYKNQANQYQIMLATDRMSEGFNLNRAGAVINLDIPWNPTRVIQRVGRINRISKKVFDNLYIYNFFPTEKGATYVKSRQIAREKMFLIHNTLGEDAKIFEPDEEPSASKLFDKIQQNPEQQEQESFQTTLRRLYAEIDPMVKQKISRLPPRIKVAKQYSSYALTVFIKKGSGLFISNLNGDDKKPTEMLFEEALPLIQCTKEEPALALSDKFWTNYQLIKEQKERVIIQSSELSLEKKAYANILTLLADRTGSYQEYQDFLLILREDIEDYKTLPDYTLRRISVLKAGLKDETNIANIKAFLDDLIREMGRFYLEAVKQKTTSTVKEVIVAVENHEVVNE